MGEDNLSAASRALLFTHSPIHSHLILLPKMYSDVLSTFQYLLHPVCLTEVAFSQRQVCPQANLTSRRSHYRDGSPAWVSLPVNASNLTGPRRLVNGAAQVPTLTIIVYV